MFLENDGLAIQVVISWGKEGMGVMEHGGWERDRPGVVENEGKGGN